MPFSCEYYQVRWIRVRNYEQGKMLHQRKQRQENDKDSDSSSKIFDGGPDQVKNTVFITQLKGKLTKK